MATMDLFVATSPIEHLHPSFRVIQQARKNQASRRIMQLVFDRLPQPRVRSLSLRTVWFIDGRAPEFGGSVIGIAKVLPE